jgi:hypothetical protein
MPLTPGRPVPPQPTAQPGLPIATFPGGGLQDIVSTAKPTVSGLNANVTQAVVTTSSIDILGTLKIVTAVITFNTNAAIPLGQNLFTVAYGITFVGTPVVVCGGGPVFNNLFEAASTNPSAFLMFNEAALVNGNGQGVQWIAIGH